jgi:YVTN family beta-propeller protein
VINTTTDTVISTIPVGNVPVGVAVSLDGTKVYVTNFGNDDFPGRNVSIIDTATEEVTSINVEEGRPGKPSGVAVYPYEQKAYVAKLLNEKIRAVDLSTNEVSDIHVGTDPRGVAITPEGSKVYVANTGSNTVSVIDTATNSVIKTVGVGEAPYGVAVNKNGTKVYVTNMGSGNRQFNCRKRSSWSCGHS